MTPYEAEREHARICAGIRSISDPRRREAEVRISAARRSELREATPESTLWAKRFEERERGLLTPVDKIAAGLRGQR